VKNLTPNSAPQWWPEVTLRSITKEAERLIEQAYRNCWQSEPRTNGKDERRRFLERCIRRGHLAPLEFAAAAFEIDGSRVFTHQLVRHRLASYAQESQRYVRANDPGYIVVPPKIHADPHALTLFLEAVNQAWRTYGALLELGIRKEDARFVLPGACKSKIFVSMNFRAWRHFLKLRCDRSAQWEIRGIAMEILKVLYEEAPGVFSDLYKKYILNDGVGTLWTERD